MTVATDTRLLRSSRASDGSAPSWVGAAATAPGLLAFTGEIGAAGAHAHAAVQVLVLTVGRVALRDHDGREQVVSTAIIPAGVRHELHAAPGGHAARGVLAYLDPASRAGRAATGRVRDSGDPAVSSTWRSAADILADTLPLGSPLTGGLLARRLITFSEAGWGEPTSPRSVRQAEPPAALTRALALIPQLISGPLLLEDLAAHVGMSASRLGHLFAEHLHLPYPAWRRWARLLCAMEAVYGGASLTTAAHAAGFADSAHLARACRAMFGVTPTQALTAAGWSSLARPGATDR